jgi:hypothetical protein
LPVDASLFDESLNQAWTLLHLFIENPDRFIGALARNTQEIRALLRRIPMFRTAVPPQSLGQSNSSQTHPAGLIKIPKDA